MSDTTTGTVSADSDDVTIGKGNQQQRINPQQNMRSGDTYVGASGEFPPWKLIEMSSDIRSLIAQRLPERVERLERLEVLVRPGSPPEVIVRPIAQNTINLSVNTIMIILLVFFVVALAAVVWLVYLRVANV